MPWLYRTPVHRRRVQILYRVMMTMRTPKICLIRALANEPDVTMAMVAMASPCVVTQIVK